MSYKINTNSKVLKISSILSMGFFLELSIRPLEFGAASNANAVFFDETNSEVISVHNESEILINSQNYLRNDRKVKLKPHGPIFAIKSSISNSILGRVKIFLVKTIR